MAGTLSTVVTSVSPVPRACACISPTSTPQELNLTARLEGCYKLASWGTRAAGTQETGEDSTNHHTQGQLWQTCHSQGKALCKYFIAQDLLGGKQQKLT